MVKFTNEVPAICKLFSNIKELFDWYSEGFFIFMKFKYFIKEYVTYKTIIKESKEDFIYRKWFDKGGFDIFINDVGRCPQPPNRVYFEKLDNKKPYSPTNFIWKQTPIKSKAPKRVLTYTLDFIIPADIDLRQSGVYKITFDNNHFYIGSTKHFKNRISIYNTMFNGIGRIHNKKMALCISKCNSVKFDIVELIPDLNKLLEKETEYISQHIDNPLMINRAHDAHSNKGIRWTDEERLKVKNDLIAKYKAGLYKPTPYKYRRTKLKTEDLFRSKIFGDKEK